MVCVVLMLASGINAFFATGHHPRGKKDVPMAARDEIERLVRTLEFYDSLHKRNTAVADDAEMADSFQKMKRYVCKVNGFDCKYFG